MDTINEMDQQTRLMCREIAERIYDLDTEAYELSGSRLGNVFSGDREQMIADLTLQLLTNPNGNKLRAEVALVANLIRTLPDTGEKERMLRRHRQIVEDIHALPPRSWHMEKIGEEQMSVSRANISQMFLPEDHLIICVGRKHGSGGAGIAFHLAQDLGLNYYDERILQSILDQRHQQERDTQTKVSAFSRYHGLPKEDAAFFLQSDLIVELARKENMVIVGRGADAILSAQRIPHISVFITAPLTVRVYNIAKDHGSTMKEAMKYLKERDRQHRHFYETYSGLTWGDPANYTLCINSALLGREESVKLIERLVDARSPKMSPYEKYRKKDE